MLNPVSSIGLDTASAAEYSDGSGDNCKQYLTQGGPVVWCGPDISATADPILAGEVHLIVSMDATPCSVNVAGAVSHPRYAIFKASATWPPTGTDQLGEIVPDFGTLSFYYVDALSKTRTALTSYVSGSPVTTYEVVLPSSLTNGFGSGFKWLVGDACAGENPWQNPDTAPDTGYYNVSLGSAPSAPARPTGVAAKPGSTKSAKTGPIIVTYAAGANHGATVTKFTATCKSTNGGVRATAVHTGATAAPIMVSSATLKKSYRCTVTATNSAGTGAASAASDAVTVGAPARMAKPTVAKTALGKLRVKFSSLTSAQANGSALSTPKYTASCASSNGGVARSATGSASPIVVTGLTPGKSYTCTVKAHNSRGYGVASAPSAARTA
jgi:hypothetical protein